MAQFSILMWDIWRINLFMFIAHLTNSIHTPVLSANHFMAAVESRQPLNALINKINWLRFCFFALFLSLPLARSFFYSGLLNNFIWNDDSVCFLAVYA